MEYVELSRFFVALAFVVALIWGCGWLAKRAGLDKRMRGMTGAQGRLSVGDVLYLDPKRKLLLVKADGAEYLLLVAGETVTVVDKLGSKA